MNLGEPSVGVFVPVYPIVQEIPKELEAGIFGLSQINLAIIEREFELYDNNGTVNRYIELPVSIDETINKIKLKQIQEDIFMIENILIEEDQRIKKLLKNDVLTDDVLVKKILAQFSNIAVKYAYTNYSGERSNLIKYTDTFRLILKNLYRNIRNIF